MPGDAHAPTAASNALRLLLKARRERVPEREIIETYPEVLALYPPGITSSPQLPSTSQAPPLVASDPDPLAAARESLRFAARLVQELSARLARELGRRAAEEGTLRAAEDIAQLRFDELEATLLWRLVPHELDSAPRRAEPPLPAAFRLTASGAVVAESPGRNGGGSQGAGGGRAIGTARARMEDVGPGDVLVVRTLDPQLAGVLPMLGGLVAETGSVLSHLAILAREFQVATVVGVHDAIHRFPPGSTVIVEGDTGAVSLDQDASDER